MAQCLARSQTFSQFIRPSSLLSYTSKSKTDCVFKYYLESNEQQRIECNASSFKVIGAIGTRSFGKPCKCIHKSQLVAGNQVRINHLIHQPMSVPTNEPSREPIREPTKRMDLDAVLPNNLSHINNAVLSNHSNKREFLSLADQPGIDEEIYYPIAASDSSQPTPINLASNGLRCSSRTEVLNRRGLVYSNTTLMDHDERPTSPQITHLRSASQQSF